MRIEEIMTKDVLRLSPQEEVSGALKKLAERGVTGAPVVDEENRVIGILTETDLLRAMDPEYKKYRILYPPAIAVGIGIVEEKGYKEADEAYGSISKKTVGEIMSKEVVTVPTESHLSELIHLMVKKDVNRIPVTKDGTLVGIVCRTDVIMGLDSDAKIGELA